MPVIIPLAIGERLSVLSAKEAGGVLRVCDRTVCRLMASGELGAFRIGGKVWRTTPALLARYIREAVDRERSRH